MSDERSERARDRAAPLALSLAAIAISRSHAT
jgi:hypothetical protein